MENQPKNPERRKLLATTTAVIGGIGVGGVATPFVQSMMPSAKAKALGADIEVELDSLGPGQLRIVEWRGMPVYILHRTQEMIDHLRDLEDRLKDPASEEVSQQPEYAKNSYRSIKPEYLVVMGVCTHLGCAPSFKPEQGLVEVGEWWQGGFYCPCHQSIYDLAGRVFEGRSPAPMNLPVPPHRYVSETRIRIGDQSLKQT